MIAVAVPAFTNTANELRQEAKELNLIFNAIIHSVNKNPDS